MVGRQGKAVSRQAGRGRCGLVLFVALGLAALLSSTLAPLLHRHHAPSEARHSIASAHAALGAIGGHEDGCTAKAPATPLHCPSPGSNSPGHDDESSCPICVFVKSGQSRNVMLPPASLALSPAAPIRHVVALVDWTPLACGRPSAASPRAPPRSIT